MQARVLRPNVLTQLLSLNICAIRSSSSTGDGAFASKKAQIYSLATHKVVETLDFGEGPDHDISALDVNERGIVVVMGNSRSALA